MTSEGAITSASLDPDAFHQLIERFVADLPGILAGHHAVADLAHSAERLLTTAETPFTIAVVGQMRAGKSSLINALVGADLAVTGVNETTATVNWFRYGGPDRAGVFRAVWKDRPAEEFPIAEIRHWVGDSDRARQTRCLEFFADVPFLRKASVVDTPGTRSVLADHSRATEEFLALRQERDTREAGDAADAVIYVLPPVAREADADLLEAFERTTRVPGSSPYNSLAVVHKWETQDWESQEAADPYANAVRKCDTVRDALGKLVSDVLPVSAPLGRAAEQFPQAFWEALFALHTGSPADGLRDLLLQEKDFVSLDEPACPLSISDRKSLRSNFPLPWASFKAALAIARNRKPANPMELRDAVAEAGGIVRLRDALEARFLARARLIKAFGVLSKGLEPCRVASIRLRNHKLRQTARLEEADRAAGPLAAAVERGATELEPALRYLRETRETVDRDARQVADVLRSLEEAFVPAKDAFRDLDADMKMLELLDQVELRPEWRPLLRSLFGANGPGLDSRLAQTDGSLAAVEDLIGKVRAEAARSGPNPRKLFEHASARLQQMADLIDQ